MLFGLLFIMFYVPWSIGISLSFLPLVICFDGNKFVTSFCDPSLFASLVSVVIFCVGNFLFYVCGLLSLMVSI